MTLRRYALAAAATAAVTATVIALPMTTASAQDLAELQSLVDSIHIDAPLLNFHMYGLALEQLHKREFYQAGEKKWDVFPPHSDIREARAGRV